MTPTGWTNPITAALGQVQNDVDPARLLSSRADLIKWRLNDRRQLIAGGVRRYTLIEVTPDGVIYDGHHGTRAAAEAGLLVAVRVVDESESPSAPSVMHLPVR